MKKKKILIISQAIFPSQYPRAYRASELAKELSRQGHNVILYAVLGEYDYSEYEEKYKLTVRNIGRMLFSKLNSDGSNNRNVFDKILGKSLGRLIEFPDIELMFRIPEIFKFEKKVDLLISIAMPFPIHWGCALAKSLYPNSFPGLWVADCGDPYMGNEVSKHRKYFYFKYIEKWFCQNADYITVPVDGAQKGYYPEFADKIKVIPQGFKFDDINVCTKYEKNEIPTFAYAGVFYKGFRDPSMFLEYLKTVKLDFKFIIFTKTRELIEPHLKELGNNIEVHDYIPRDQLIHLLSHMDFLVNFENGTSLQSPSKLIDYGLARRPILSITPGCLPFDTIHEFLRGNYQHQFVVEDIEQYEITKVAMQFSSLTIG